MGKGGHGGRLRGSYRYGANGTVPCADNRNGIAWGFRASELKLFRVVEKSETHSSIYYTLSKKKEEDASVFVSRMDP